VATKRSFDWYLNFVLAGVTVLLLCLGVVFDILAPDPALQELTPGEQKFVGFTGPVVVFAVLWFWFRMLHDYFRNRPDKHAVGWGWALFLLNIGASVAYFWFVWRPRNAPTHLTDA
jgi:uncharacterized BrkB/YihY/UPF0761 family membrane protein